MSESGEDVRQHIKLYWKIGGALLMLTVLTVAVSYVEVAVPIAILLALLIAATKGSLVARYFMHLTGERRSIYATLLLTALFFLILIFIPILGYMNTYGEHKIVPNANAPMVEEATH